MKRLLALTHATVGVILALVLLTPRPVLAEPIEIAADTRMELSTETHGAVAVIRGTLRDNVGQGLGFRTVTIAFEPAPAEARSIAVQTDRLGAFEWEGSVGEGRYDVRVSYSGDRYFDPASANAQIETARGRPTIRIAGPRTVSVGAPEFGVQVLASTADGNVDPERISVTSSCAGVRFDAVTLAAMIAPPVGPGRCDLEVRVEEAPEHLAAAHTWELRAVDNPRLYVEAEVIRASPFTPPSWQVRGTLEDAAGPITGGTAIIDIEGNQITEAGWTTSGFEAFLAGESVAPGTHVVRVQWSPDHNGEGEEPVVQEIEVIYERSAVEWVPLLSAGGVALIVLAMLTFYSRARRLRPDEPLNDSPPVVAGVETEEDDDEVARWRGRVIDTATRESVAARVWLMHEDGREDELDVRRGRFEIEPFEVDHLRFRAEAAGYLALDDRSPAPASGQRIVLRMVSVRSRVRAILETVVERVGPSDVPERWWGKKTLEEMRPILRDSLRSLRRGGDEEPIARRELQRLVEAAEAGGDSATAVDALALLAEEVYFSGRPFEPDVIELAESLAERVRTRSREEGE